MKLVIKTIIPCTEINSNGSTKGGYTFELMDYAGVTFLNELFVNTLPENHALVTNDANIKYIRSIFAYDYIEIFAKLSDATSGRLITEVQLYSRNRKSTEWNLSATANFSFAIIDTNTRKIVRIPKEIINAIKG
jgi:acyl-CoA thioesterase FadM